MQPKHDKPGPGAVAVLDAVIALVAEDEAEDGTSTPDQARWARGVAQAVAVRVAELRRQLTPVRPVIKRAAPVGSQIRALDRVGLLTRLEALRQGEQVRYAHQDLTGLSDDDLRRMLAILEAPTEG
jgi:hypothetical protein